MAKAQSASCLTSEKTLIACIVILVCVVLVAEFVVRTLPRWNVEEQFCIEPKNCGSMSDILSTYLKEKINDSFARLQKDEENRQKERAKSKSYISLKSYLKNTYWQMTPAARIIGDPNTHGYDICGNNILCMVDMQPILHWTHSGRVRENSVFLRHGIKFREGRLVVPVGGTYYVYTYLEIHEPIWNKDTNEGRPAIRHALHKFNILKVKEEELILQTHLHKDTTESDYNVYNSRIESVVELDAGDELIVKFSNVTYLKYPASNYFGINMV